MSPTQSRDSSHCYIHLHASHHADLFEDFCSASSRLPTDDIYVPIHNQPLNPEDEDDVVPDQHAAFGITRALAGAKKPGEEGREKAWKDLGLAELMERGPKGSNSGVGLSSASGNRGKSQVPR